MKIVNKKIISKKKLLIILLLIVIVSAGVLALDKFGIVTIFPRNNIPDISKEPLKEEKEQESHNSSTEKESLLDAAKDNQSQGTAVPTPTSNANISLSVNKEGGNVIIIAKLKEQGFSEGQCKLLVSANSKTVEQSAEIIYQPEYSTCSGFSVPLSALGSGTWNIKLSVTPINGTTITLSETKEV